VNVLYIQGIHFSHTQQFFYTITFKATCFNSIELGPLKNRSNYQHLYCVLRTQKLIMDGTVSI